jgi:hypothetical protein
MNELAILLLPAGPPTQECTFGPKPNVSPYVNWPPPTEEIPPYCP